MIPLGTKRPIRLIDRSQNTQPIRRRKSARNKLRDLVSARGARSTRNVNLGASAKLINAARSHDPRSHARAVMMPRG